VQLRGLVPKCGCYPLNLGALPEICGGDLCQRPYPMTALDPSRLLNDPTYDTESGRDSRLAE
jgi:hypothetical protein